MTENSVLSELAFHQDQGALRFKGVRYLLIRPETLVSFQRALETEVGFEAAAQILYTGGFTGGQLSGKRYRDEFGFRPAEVVEFMCRMGGEIGWGRFQTVELDLETRRLVVEVVSSPFAEAYGSKPAAGVCHLTRGVFGGLWSGVLGVGVRSAESQCLARGGERCRFEFGPNHASG